MDTLSFKKRCALLTVSVLRTRTPFAKFLLSTLHLPRGSLASASPAFPLPIPFPGVFARMPPGLSSAKRCRIINFRRALHVVAMALSFWFAGSCFVPREHLERALSKNQHAILHRLSGLLLADGPTEELEILGSGRRFPQLISSLCVGLLDKVGGWCSTVRENLSWPFCSNGHCTVS